MEFLRQHKMDRRERRREKEEQQEEEREERLAGDDDGDRRRRRGSQQQQQESRRRRRSSSRATEHSGAPPQDTRTTTTTYCYEVPLSGSRSQRRPTTTTSRSHRRRGESASRSSSDEDHEIRVMAQAQLDEARPRRHGSVSSGRHSTSRRSSRRPPDAYHGISRTKDDDVSRPPLSRSHSYAVRHLVVPEAPPVATYRRSASSAAHYSDTEASDLKRSQTLRTSHSRSSSYTPSLSSSRGGRGLGSFFGLSSVQSREPERVIECLTCGDDDVPRSRSAQLKCGHRMCNSCLRRVFKMSITDPQHMPPRCCTEDHISLKHVDKLFDNDFKRAWNRKFQEYSTKDRIYCPERRCGEWIKPTNIQRDSHGRKYGKCGRCALRVCCQCNGKYHGKRACHRDPETKKLLSQAKEAGWQRCYNCRSLVELKEGCNHMTCRCQAQFCMICARKWKTCGCPWFNYTSPAPEDRLPTTEEDILPPRTYQTEMLRRRAQERDDALLAQRIQASTYRETRDRKAGSDLYDDAPVGYVHGIGNAGAHLLNESYQRASGPATTTVYNILPGLRRTTSEPVAAHDVSRAAQGQAGAHAANAPSSRRQVHRMTGWGGTRDFLLPRRDKDRGDYAQQQQQQQQQQQAVFHAPFPSQPDAGKPAKPARSVKASAQAGLPGRGSGRVETWRAYVEAGEPEGGALSI